jgi:UDP-N-acetyl-2-amino-2-deoxyglucuronate dehydrogenase
VAIDKPRDLAYDLRMHFSIIGTGFIMPRHAEAIHEVGGKILHAVNTARGTDAWRDAVLDPRTDAVVILTPNDLHVPMVRFAAECGKLVLCEKPLGVSSDAVLSLVAFENVFTVLQLRHHPLAALFRATFGTRPGREIEMDIVVRRGENYFSTWKGDAARSGGVLYNIGIHYFDLLLNVFGVPLRVRTDEAAEDGARGLIEGERYRCRWSVRIDRSGSRQWRRFIVDGRAYDLSSRSSLSQEDLHLAVYREFVEGRGVGPIEALKSVTLVESLNAPVLCGSSS